MRAIQIIGIWVFGLLGSFFVGITFDIAVTGEMGGAAIGGPLLFSAMRLWRVIELQGF